jgi:hypothetical protein
VGGDHSSPTSTPSLGTWSDASSLSDLGGVPNTFLLQYSACGQDLDGCNDHQHPTELLHRTEVQLDVAIQPGSATLLV